MRFILEHHVRMRSSATSIRRTYCVLQKKIVPTGISSSPTIVSKHSGIGDQQRKHWDRGSCGRLESSDAVGQRRTPLGLRFDDRTGLSYLPFRTRTRRVPLDELLRSSSNIIKSHASVQRVSGALRKDRLGFYPSKSRATTAVPGDSTHPSCYNTGMGLTIHCLPMGGNEALAFRRNLQVMMCEWRTTDSAFEQGVLGSAHVGARLLRHDVGQRDRRYDSRVHSDAGRTKERRRCKFPG